MGYYLILRREAGRPLSQVPGDPEDMSRAFVNDDAGSARPAKEFGLPRRDDPAYDAVSAEVLLEAARGGDTSSAEQARRFLR